MFKFISFARSASNERVGDLSPPRSRRKSVVLGAVAFVLVALGSAGAQAQNCTGSVDASTSAGLLEVGNVASFGVATAANLGAAINTANTAFLTQSTAFVASPPNPLPDQQGGGVWVRGVGGEVDVKSASTTNVNVSLPSFPPSGASGSTVLNCDTRVHETFAGVQVGADISKLNIGGWNVHLGITAGNIGAKGDTVGGVGYLGGTPFTNSFEVPFFGGYAAVTNGGFFADALVRGDFYQGNLNSPSLNLFNQSQDAQGITIGGSAGYQFKPANSNWFIEPSGGLIYSRVHVDAVNGLSPPVLGSSGSSIQGTLQLNDIESTTGRLGLRVGESFSAGNVVWTPFAAVSAWTDFGASIKGSYSTCGSPTQGGTAQQDCIFYGSYPAQITSNFTAQGIGTYGQYSLGISGQIVNTGWLGFARVDFRDGDRLEGWDGTAGIRYQFSPDMLAAAKMPIYKATPVAHYNWTGVYVGGVIGADAGWSRENFGGVYNPAVFTAATGVGGVNDVGPNPKGLLGGVEVGYNYQFGQWVVGVEADATDSSTKGSTACTDLNTPGNGAGLIRDPAHPLFDTNCGAQANWIETVTGRFGFASDRALFYAKGGAAFAHETFTATCNLGPNNDTVAAPASQSCYDPAGALLSNFAGSTNAWGGTGGLGVEFAVSRDWSAKAEWDYIYLGSRNLVASDGTAINAGMSLNEVKVGVNYHLTP
jgi:opacity protein-like surface antigen